MANDDLTADFSTLLTDKVRLRGPISGLRAAYQSGTPFPHLVLDDFFSPQILESLPAEISALTADEWLLMANDSRERVLRMRSGVQLREAGMKLLSLVHSASFLYLLSEITGIWQLLPDPYLQGAGYAAMRPGDHFDIHSDRSVAYETGLTRRLAMIVFLNKDWRPEYNGDLELWSDDGTRREVSIAPSFNRTVIFQVANPNYHGVPAPIACPQDRCRQSFIVYYHTVGIDGNLNVRPHSSIFAPNFYRPRRAAFNRFAHEVTPPVIARALRKLLRLGKPQVKP
jgi:2OG-Fe(II) oxygenase superfamily